MTVVSPCTQNLMDSAHPHTVLNKLNEQRAQGLFCDVTIVVEDVKFRAHKNILAACSGYFKNALTTPETVSSSQVLELMDLKSEVFASILNYIYCSKVTLPGTEDTGGLVAAGKRLGIPFLEKLAEQERQDECVKSTDSSTVPLSKKTKKEAPRPEEIDSAKGPLSKSTEGKDNSQWDNKKVCPLGRSILPTPAEPQTDKPNAITPTLADAVSAAPVAVMTPPPLFSEAETEKSTDPVLPIAADSVQMELGPPTLSPHTEDSISIYGCEHYTTDISTKGVDLHSDGLPIMENTMTQLPPADLSTPCTPEPLQVDESEPPQEERVVRPGGSQRRYNCSVCKRVYVTLSSLKRHENVHSWQRAYPCHYCNKVFALLSASAKRVEDMTKELLQSSNENLVRDKMVGAKTETYIAKPACP
uniref:Zinc finger and BTB domain-containing protein 38 n=1 Tax=Dicentrarchus labrax TaxID=13489 RepID=A0A8P4KT00_DICLA